MATVGELERIKPLLMDVQEVSKMLACSTRHVFRMCDAGLMPAPVKLGVLVRWRIKTGDPSTGLNDWIDAKCPAVRKVVA